MGERLVPTVTRNYSLPIDHDRVDSAHAGDDVGV